MEKSVLIDIEDAKTAEIEVRDSFIKEVLLSVLDDTIGAEELQKIWPEDQLETVENKIKFRRLMTKYDIDILYDGDRGIEIYVGDDLIAQWNKPKFVLRSDPSARRKKTFYEMIISYESLFEEGE